MIRKAVLFLLTSAAAATAIAAVVGLQGHPYRSWRLLGAGKVTLMDTRLVIELRKLPDFSSAGPLITHPRLLARPPGTPDTWWSRLVYRNREPLRFAGLFLHTRLDPLPHVSSGFMPSEMRAMSADPTYREKVWRIQRGILYMWLPLWMPLVLFAAYPGYALVTHGSRRRRQRRKHGLCLECGYNLTGNVSGICPECGSRCGPDASQRAEFRGREQNT